MYLNIGYNLNSVSKTIPNRNSVRKPNFVQPDLIRSDNITFCGLNIKLKINSLDVLYFIRRFEREYLGIKGNLDSTTKLLDNIVSPAQDKLSEINTNIFYHATTKKALFKIKLHGFNTKLGNKKEFAGYGVYLGFKPCDVEDILGCNTLARFKVNIKNPCILDRPDAFDTFDKLKEALIDKIAAEYPPEERITLFNESIGMLFKNKGYDGLMIIYPKSCVTHLVVFDPENVKLVRKD